MIAGIGVDSVEIARFNHWVNISEKKLLKIFSKTEITYCLSNHTKSAERFAARFSAKEAFFKALCQIDLNNKLPFLTICKHTVIKHNKNGCPSLNADWEHLFKNTTLQKQKYKIFISITHTKQIATTFVIITRID